MNTIKYTSGALGAALFFVATLLLMAYFAFAAIQGNFGHFKRNLINADMNERQHELAALKTHHKHMVNKTHRMSDQYLDLDLLDEQARKVLGMARETEVIIR